MLNGSRCIVYEKGWKHAKIFAMSAINFFAQQMVHFDSFSKSCTASEILIHIFVFITQIN